MLKVVRYDSHLKNQWDTFIDRSINGLFQHKRDFIAYHGDRFKDASLMVFNDKSLLCCFPGIIADEVYYSHPGLGYGDILVAKASTRKHKLVLECILNYLQKEGIQDLVIRRIPNSYIGLNRTSLEYFVQKTRPKIHDTLLSMHMSTISNQNYSSHTKRVIKGIGGDVDLAPISVIEFHQALSDHLRKTYETEPLHTNSELIYLNQTFPKNIRCYQLIKGGSSIAGCCMFLYRNIAKLQYLYSDEGDSSRILLHLVKHKFINYRTIDLGTSNSLEGKKLNFGNILFKESLGGQAHISQTVSIIVNEAIKLLEDE